MVVIRNGMVVRVEEDMEEVHMVVALVPVGLEECQTFNQTTVRAIS